MLEGRHGNPNTFPNISRRSFLLVQIRGNLIDPGHEKAQLGIALPHQHAQRVSVLARVLVLGRRLELFHQESRHGPHPVALDLPEPDLIDDRRREHWIILLHLRVGVRGQVADDLVARDPRRDGVLDRLLRQLARHHVGKASDETGEEGEDGDLERGLGVSVDAVVGFDYNIPLSVT